MANSLFDSSLMEIRTIVNMFLKPGNSFEDVAKETNLSPKTIQDKLKNKNIILMAFPDDGEEKFKQVTDKLNKMYNVKVENNLPALKLELFSKDPTNQIKYLIHLALTFRVKLPTLASLFHIDERELNNRILAVNPFDNAIKYLFYTDETDQSVARSNLVQFYYTLINAVHKKDDLKIKELINSITDYDAKELLKKRQKGTKLTKEEAYIMLQYQLKYALNKKQTASHFGVDDTNYSNLVNEILNDDSNLKSHYEFMTDYRRNSQLNASKRNY